MLYHLLYPLHVQFSGFHVFRYITFRSIYAAITALTISFIVGPWLIAKLRRLQIGQEIRELGPESHKKKAGTPTMGGVLILTAMVVPTLLWADLRNMYVWLVLFVTVGYGAVGAVDDWRKVARHNSDGLSARAKMRWMTLIAAIPAVILLCHPNFQTTLAFPFLKNLRPDLGLFFVVFAVFVVVGSGNSVNLSDGLDGLAMGLVTIAASVYVLFAYLAGNAHLASYLQLSSVPGAGELAVFCSAMVGAGLGFLWFNAYPAQIFMGDTGSLALGGALGMVAIVVKQELMLALVGGIFVLEALSVMLQVTSYKLWKRRIFKMAPLHHHFELMGIAEPKIIVRFWIVNIILALLAISTLKLR
ncbi:MAG: phospho-N-acetylmuramoyl-pentapeptide-transferase [Deltaproteobacteria bacterium]|nr:phospho-N-acetylmuramoyl-pentapeptide-transferase [Deltaproteobacteria bacterium]